MALVDTETLALAAGLHPATIRRYTTQGILTPVGTAIRNGRPGYRYNLDQALATLSTTLDKTTPPHESDQ